MTTENPFGETIYSYSRAHAIEDGVFIDLSQADSIRQHWKYPFACTSVACTIIEEALQQPGQDVSGICHDIATMPSSPSVARRTQSWSGSASPSQSGPTP